MKINELVVDDLYVNDPTGAPTTGLTGADFSLSARCGATTAAVTLTEVGAGVYLIEFTPTVAGQWLINVDYDTLKFHWGGRYEVTASSIDDKPNSSQIGVINILPFTPDVSLDAITQGAEAHIVRGDSVAIPFSIGRDITGWEVWTGGKVSPGSTEYVIEPRNISSDMTDLLTGSGLIKLSTSDTDYSGKRFQQEIELRRGDEVSTALRFPIVVTQDIIREPVIP